MNITNILNVVNSIHSETGKNKCYLLSLSQQCYHAVKNNINQSLF